MKVVPFLFCITIYREAPDNIMLHCCNSAVVNSILVYKILIMKTKAKGINPRFALLIPLRQIAGFICIGFILICTGCNDDREPVASVYEYIKPSYSPIHLKVVPDTLVFKLSESMFNEVESYNIFVQDGVTYFAVHDKRGKSINIYNFASRDLVKRYFFKDMFPTERLYKNSMYVKNFDSIFVTNNVSLCIFDKNGVRKKTINFFDESRTPKPAFKVTSPPVLKGDTLYMGVNTHVSETSLDELKRWKAMYQFNLHTRKFAMVYHYPRQYQENFFGNSFLYCYYCYNDRGNVVFSFAADTVIYETNFTDYHKAYYAKSRFQQANIDPVPEQTLVKKEGSKAFLLRDSYNVILFDPYKKRYIRIARQKMSEADVEARKGTYTTSAIIFDDNFKIIGESELNDTFALGSVFFTPDGNMYARVMSKDENALRFVRLTYSEEPAHAETPPVSTAYHIAPHK